MAQNEMIKDLATIFWQSGSVIRSETLTESMFDEDIITTIDIPPKVMLFNDDHHTFDEVISQLCKATGCSTQHAEACAWEVHTKGKCIVFDGDIGECLRVSSVLEEIALHTQILN